uniref:Terminase n=1 Tax=viral metagenome TaxID=1070528 RepID=A0A6H1ZX16_9ZZZZ
MDKKKQRIKKRKAVKALEEIENLYISIMEIFDNQGDKIIKKYPALAVSIKDYRNTVDQELSWLYEEANIVLNLKVLPETNYSVEDFILERGYDPKPASTVVQDTVKRKQEGLGEGKRLFEGEK